jgi:O-antigen/teichoic acid export membrane protein
MSAPPTSSATPTERAGRRVLANTVLRVVGELVGKIMSFAVFAVLARVVGQNSVGSYVVAFAYVQIAMIFVDLGFDRVIIRRVATDIASMPRIFSEVIALKCLLLVPVLAASWTLAPVIGYHGQTQTAIELLTLGQFFDALNRSVFSVMSARERGGLLTVMVVLERSAGAVLGIAALLAGFGMISVCITYALGSAIGFVIGLTLLVRRIGALPRRVSLTRWRVLILESLPFAMYDSLSFLFTKVDTIILSLLATHAAVALYGGASRLYEASFFITYSINGTFMAMYTYLSPTSEPPIGMVFGRSIKLVLALLAPITVTWMVEARPLSTLFFGNAFLGTSGPLRLLAPAVVLMGVANLSSSIVALRAGARTLLPLTAGALVMNITLNVVLIPVLGASGAGLAMSLALVPFAAVGLWLATRQIGAIPIVRILISPAVAGIGMALVMLFVVGPLVPAIACGMVVYLLAFVLVERRLAPQDLRFMLAILRRSGPVST